MGLFGKSKKEKEAEYMERINVPQCPETGFYHECGRSFYYCRKWNGSSRKD